MINSSQLGGNSLAIGDITQSYRAVLPDGKRLVTCDGTLVDGGAYPLLAAAMTPRQKFVKVWRAGATNNSNIHAVAVADGSKLIAFDNAASGGLTSYNALLDTSVLLKTASGRLNSGLGASADGKYIAIAYISATQCQVAVSADFGATFTSDVLVTTGVFVVTTASYAAEIVNMWVKNDGSVMRIALLCSQTSQTLKFFESVNFGANWSPIWVDATVYTDLNNCRGTFSEDGNKYVVYPYLGYGTATAKLLIESGVRTVITGDPLIYPITTQLAMLLSPDGNTLVLAGRAPTTRNLVVSYSTDKGATWIPQVREVMDSLRTQVRITINTQMVHSLVIPNTVYVYITSLYSPTVIMAINYVTGEITMVTTVLSSSGSGSVNTNSVTKVTRSHTRPTREYLAIADIFTTSACIYTIDYDKYLPSPPIDNSFPFKVVADTI
jgi:hypothetical protein